MKSDGGYTNFFFKRRTFLLVFFFSLLGFLLVLILRSKFSSVDLSINQYIALNQGTFFLPVSLGLHYTFDTLPMFVICAVLVIFLYLRKFKKYSILLAVTMLGEWIITTVVKAATHVPRPETL